MAIRLTERGGLGSSPKCGPFSALSRTGHRFSWPVPAAQAALFSGTVYTTSKLPSVVATLLDDQAANRPCVRCVDLPQRSRASWRGAAVLCYVLRKLSPFLKPHRTKRMSHHMFRPVGPLPPQNARTWEFSEIAPPPVQSPCAMVFGDECPSPTSARD
jgi:hypothetical protein